MIDILSIQSGIVRTVSTLVGDQLSTIKGEAGDIPSVFKMRQKPPRPSFPYIVVGGGTSDKVGYSYKTRYFNEDGNEVYEYDKILTFFIDVHSKVDTNSLSIASNLRDLFFTSYGKDLLCSNANVSVLRVDEPTFSPTLMNTDYEEVSRIIFRVSANNIIVDTQTGQITNVSVDGELYLDYDQIESPVDINIIAP